MFAFYAARLANLFAALALIGIALHVADGLRTIIAAVALLPMTLFEFASWSPDAMSIAASILFISLLLRAMSADVSAVALCTTAFLVGLCKPAYFLTAFLVLLIPRKRIALLVLLSTAVATVLSFSYAHMAAYAQRGALPIDPASQIQCIVSAPARFVSVVSRE